MSYYIASRLISSCSCRSRLSTTFTSLRRYSASASAAAPPSGAVEPKDQSTTAEGRQPHLSPNYRYPEFLPDPKLEWRNPIREKLERQDMFNRRKNVDIPPFYVGSILAVTTSDPHAEGKTTRFVGICTERTGCGLRADFALRNVIDHQGVEVLYDMYDPTIQKVEVLRLERRLDDNLRYLRDAKPEYSTVDPNMEQELLPEGAPVPLNPIKVEMNPFPWREKWEQRGIKGASNLMEMCSEYRLKKMKKNEAPWEKYDLMKEYRRTIPAEEQQQIFSEVYSHMHQLEMERKKLKRKRTFVKPKKLA